MRKQLCLEDIIQSALDSERATTYHVMPGIVQAYHAGTATSPATVDVQPATHDVRFVSATGERVSEPWPVITGVRLIVFYAGPFMISAPMSAGDGVVLLGFDLDPTGTIRSGTPADPADTRRHAGGYWCALPGDIADANAFADGPAVAQGLVLGTDGGQDQIRFVGGCVQLGATGGDYIALASLVALELQKIQTTIAGLQTATPSGYLVTVPPGAAGGTFSCVPASTTEISAVSTSPYTPASVASALIKAQ